MGLMERLFKTVRFPSFRVGIYGKLPCHKEYLHAGTDALFSELKRCLDRGFERRISAHLEPPHVLPDRRIYVAGNAGDDLVGCVFESDDGQRHFPFIMAASLPSRLFRKPFPIAWQTLDRVWRYLEAYFADLRAQADAASVYARVRGVVHNPDAFVPEPWEEPSTPIHPEQAEGLLRIVLPRDEPSAERLAIRDLPRWLAWPATSWQSQIADEAIAWLGANGFADIRVDQLRQERQVVASPAASLVPERIDLQEPDPPAEPGDEPGNDEPGDEEPMFAPPMPLSQSPNEEPS